jgi:hypothetical protein
MKIGKAKGGRQAHFVPLSHTPLCSITGIGSHLVSWMLLIMTAFVADFAIVVAQAVNDRCSRIAAVVIVLENLSMLELGHTWELVFRAS